MSHVFGFLIESLVAVLLVLTIAYCILLNKRLTRLRADEQSLKATISELITATEIAERAIGGLKQTARECERTLGPQLALAEELQVRLGRQNQEGEAVLARLSRIALAARPRGEMAEPEPSAPRSLVDAAQAFSDRIRGRASVAA